MNNTGAQPSRFNNDPHSRTSEWTNVVMDADDDEDSGIELVTVNNYQHRNINQLVSFTIFFLISHLFFRIVDCLPSGPLLLC